MLMLKIRHLIYGCSQSTGPKIPQQFKAVLAYYKSGKSTVSISQNIVSLEEVSEKIYPNYYIQEQMCEQIEKQSPGFLEKSTRDIQYQGSSLHNIYRLLVKANIGNKDLGLNINQLKSSHHIRKLIQIKNGGKFITKTSQVIIDDSIDHKKDNQQQGMLKANILQTQKLIQTGLNIPISFLISKKNVQSKVWLNRLSKKRKAIHSDIIQCFCQSQESKQTNKFQQFVYNHGYKLEHLFLRPYSRGCPTDLFINNDAFNIQQVLKILSIIDFQGKIVLQNTKNFKENIEYLDNAFKKCGFKKKKSGDLDLIEQYMIF